MDGISNYEDMLVMMKTRSAQIFHSTDWKNVLQQMKHRDSVTPLSEGQQRTCNAQCLLCTL